MPTFHIASCTPLPKDVYLLCSLVFLTITSLRAMFNGRINEGLDGHSGFENSAFHLYPQRGTARKTLGWTSMVAEHLLVKLISHPHETHVTLALFSCDPWLSDVPFTASLGRTGPMILLPSFTEILCLIIRAKILSSTLMNNCRRFEGACRFWPNERAREMPNRPEEVLCHHFNKLNATEWTSPVE